MANCSSLPNAREERDTPEKAENEKMMDWISLWDELVRVQNCGYAHDKRLDKPDHWQNRAKEFDDHVRRRWQQADSSRTFILSQLDALPGATVLDIGAGTGAWEMLLARHVSRITAVEPSPAMLQVLHSNLESEKITNVEIVEDTWPHAQVGVHDFTLCSHAMYGFPDFVLFIQSIAAVTRHLCFLLIRAPTMDGVMAEAARHVWGHPYDSPNYQVALNALLQMGIFPNVVMEDLGRWEPWASESLEDARDQIKRRLGLSQTTEHDDFLLDLAQRRLTREDHTYVWPRAMRTALVYWAVASEMQK
jgi:SAM-dependent methyltransferase